MHVDGSSVWRSAEDSDLWSHGHLSHAWSGGFVLFDNGDHSAARVSSIAEFAYDEDARTIETRYRFFHPEGAHTASMGDVRKLRDGNYLASWAGLGTINEIDPDTDTIVFEVQAALGMNVGRVHPIRNLYDMTAP